MLLIAKVTEEAVEEAREKVMVRSGRIDHHLVVKQFIFEIIERAKSMTARDFAAVEVCGFEEMLVVGLRCSISVVRPLDEHENGKRLIEFPGSGRKNEQRPYCTGHEIRIVNLTRALDHVIPRRDVSEIARGCVSSA